MHIKTGLPKFAVILGLSLAAGCFTVRETPHPSVSVPALPAERNLRVQVAGFDATTVAYDVVHGYETVVDCSPYCRRHGWWAGGTRTCLTTTLLPRVESSAYYRNRASDALERAGCVLKSNAPQYQVEVAFEGPFSEDGDGWATFGWLVGTLFTAEYGAQDWVAHLRIYDLSSGKLVHDKELVERDEVIVWGPIPFFSPGCSDRTSGGVMKALCLTALTDRAVAEAMSFLSSR